MHQPTCRFGLGLLGAALGLAAGLGGLAGCVDAKCGRSGGCDYARSGGSVLGDADCTDPFVLVFYGGVVVIAVIWKVVEELCRRE